jgi:hypothetical protein
MIVGARLDELFPDSSADSPRTLPVVKLVVLPVRTAETTL